jgi:N-carbamoylputrescine amidase
MPRPVRIATCTLETDFKTSARAQALQLVDEAGRRGADIVCLPEYAAAEHGADGRWVPAAVPGPVVEEFAALAARHRIWTIVPLIEANAGGKPWNTAVLLDRCGAIAGRYRKTHLCMPEFEEGESLAAGDAVPVFKTDFGTIGLTLCMDLHYPELYTTLALRGAEIIFWSSGAMDYTGDAIESLVKARALDAQVYFVCSHQLETPYLAGRPYGRSRIVDCMGRIRADTGHFPGVALAEVDLEQTYPTWYTGAMQQAYPDFRAALFRTRRPELYGEVVQPVVPAHFRRDGP